MSLRIYNPTTKEIPACVVISLQPNIELSLSTIMEGPPELRVFLKTVSGNREDITHMFFTDGDNVMATADNIRRVFSLFEACKELLGRMTGG